VRGVVCFEELKRGGLGWIGFGQIISDKEIFLKLSIQPFITLGNIYKPLSPANHQNTYSASPLLPQSGPLANKA
jgi:hypothetical protein